MSEGIENTVCSENSVDRSHRNGSFGIEMKEMAEDPAIQQELSSIGQDLAEAEGDGLQ